MDYDKLIDEIKLSLLYTTNLKNENEFLLVQIASLQNEKKNLSTILSNKESMINQLISRYATVKFNHV